MLSCGYLQTCYISHMAQSSEMYIGRVRLSACLYVCISPYVNTTARRLPLCNLGDGRECTLVVHYWADLQSVYGFRCYGNTRAYCEMSARTLVLAVLYAFSLVSFQEERNDQLLCCVEHKPQLCICDQLTTGLLVLCCCRPVLAPDRAPRSRPTLMRRRRLEQKDRMHLSEVAVCRPVFLSANRVRHLFFPPSMTLAVHFHRNLLVST